MKALAYCVEPLTDFELIASEAALGGNPWPLVELIEAQPLLFHSEERMSNNLVDARKSARNRLRKLGLSRSPDSTVTRYFGGVYFSFLQAAYLDAAMAHAKTAAPQERATLQAVVLSAASSLVNTIGKQFAQPVRPRAKDGSLKSSVMNGAIRDRSVDASSIHQKWLAQYGDLPATHRDHKAIRGDYADVLTSMGEDYSAVYADPPYTRDHYSRFYHVLETMCLRDEPSVSVSNRNGIVQPSRGVYREVRHQSPFCVKSEAPQAFEVLFAKSSGKGLPLVLSYSPSEEGDGTHPRVLSATDVLEIARRHYRRVDVEYIGGKMHNKHNRSDLGLSKREHAEMIIIGSH